MLEKNLRQLDTPQPLYIRLYEHLRQYIDTEKARKCGKLPTEKELSAMFKISRNTVCQALNMLENEQLICRIKHRGTFLTSSLNEFDPQNIRRTIGVVFPDSPSWQDAVAAIGKICRTTGYDYKLYTYEWRNSEDEMRVIEKAQKRSRGLILYPGSNGTDADWIRSISGNYPLVLFDLHIIGLECNSVASDHYQGAYTLATALIKRNCRKFCIIADNRKISTIHLRQSGYIQAMRDHGIAFDDSCIWQGAADHELIDFLQAGKFDALLDTSRHLLPGGIPGKKIWFARFDRVEEPEINGFHTAVAEQNKKEIGTQAALLLKNVLRYGALPGRRILISPTIKLND